MPNVSQTLFFQLPNIMYTILCRCRNVSPDIGSFEYEVNYRYIKKMQKYNALQHKDMEI